MPITIKVNFSGLCVFVPHTDGTLTVLLVDARNPGNPDVVSQHERFFPHIPTLSFGGNSLVGGVSASGTPRFDYLNRRKNTDIVWPLNGDDLEIKVGGNPLPLSGVTRTPNFDTMIPAMSSIYASSGGVNVDRHLLDGSLDPRLVARITFNQGVFDVSSVIAHQVSAEFRSQVPNAPPHVPTATYSNHAVCTISGIAGSSVEILSGAINFQLLPNAAGDIELSFSNMPPANEVGLAPASLKEPDRDFELVYRAVDPNILGSLRPLRVYTAIFSPTALPPSFPPLVCNLARFKDELPRT